MPLRHMVFESILVVEEEMSSQVQNTLLQDRENITCRLQIKHSYVRKFYVMPWELVAMAAKRLRMITHCHWANVIAKSSIECRSMDDQKADHA